MIYFSSTPLLLSYILSLVHMMKDLKLRSNIMCCHGICWNWGGLKCLNHKYPPHSVLINKDPLAKKKKKNLLYQKTRYSSWKSGCPWQPMEIFKQTDHLFSTGTRGHSTPLILQRLTRTAPASSLCFQIQLMS